jgi:hypothetical protein
MLFNKCILFCQWDARKLRFFRLIRTWEYEISKQIKTLLVSKLTRLSIFQIGVVVDDICE